MEPRDTPATFLDAASGCFGDEIPLRAYSNCGLENSSVKSILQPIAFEHCVENSGAQKYIKTYVF